MHLFKKEKEINKNENITIRVHEAVMPEKEHKHDFIELVYILSGSGTHIIDNEAYDVSHGDLIFISVGQTHSCIVNDKIRFVNILLDPQFLSNELIDSESIMEMFAHSMFAEFSEMKKIDMQCVRFSGKEREETDEIIDMMVLEYKNKKIGYKSALGGYIRILFTYILRKLHSGNELREIMPDILNYIDEHCSEKIHLADIAAKSFYNPAYFSRLLKQQCGKSFCTYVKEKRINKAAALLKNNSESVESIMHQCGYKDKKLFYSHFREIYKISPGEYRKKE